MPSALAEWRVLSGGIDEVDLWELPGVHTFHGFPGIAETSPEVAVGDVQAALRDALKRGLVQLYDESARSEMEPAEAMAVADDPAFFDREATPREVFVVITEAGEAASSDAWNRYRAQSAKRRAAGS